MDNLEKVERITFRSLRDDFIEILNFEKGLPFTCKELIIHPGFTLDQYLSTSQRNRYSKPFNSVLILLGILTLALALSGVSGSFFDGLLEGYTSEGQDSSIFNQVLATLFLEYPSLLFLIWIPLNGLICNIIFKKSGLNLAEHFIVNAYLLVVQSIIGIVGAITAYQFGDYLIFYFVLLSIIFQFFLYYDFYQKCIAVKHVILRTFLSVLIGIPLYIFFSTVIGTAIAGVFYLISLV